MLVVSFLPILIRAAIRAAVILPQKVSALTSATAAMDEATCSAWCREQGLYPAELDTWKQDAIAGLGEPRAASAAEAREDRRRVKDLHRKDKALAETAALLVLSKKSRRSSTTARTHDPPGRPLDPHWPDRASPRAGRTARPSLCSSRYRCPYAATMAEQ
jgi:hypothetical protein